MAISFEQIEPDFTRLRDFVLNDLDAIIAQPVGGNYAAAAIIACAYDAIADLRDGASNAGERPFRETLPEPWRPVAHSLYDALRNGLVHGYDTQRIHLDGRDIELAIAWRSGRHLTFANGHLVLAVPDLAAGLRRAFDAYEAALREDGALCATAFSSASVVAASATWEAQPSATHGATCSQGLRRPEPSRWRRMTALWSLRGRLDSLLHSSAAVMRAGSELARSGPAQPALVAGLPDGV